MHNQRLNGGDEFEVIWVGQNSEGKAITQKGIVKDNKDGTYAVFYNFTVSGKFQVHIRESTEDIKDSPYPAYIRPGNLPYSHLLIQKIVGPSDMYTCTVAGSGISKGKVGTPCQLVISARDKFGNRQDRGGENFQVKVTGPSGAAPKAVIDDTGEGLYNVAWTAGWEGAYTVHIFLDSSPLNGSPFMVTITP